MPLRILILEDVRADVDLIEHELERARTACVTRWVDNLAAFEREVVDFVPDVILADYLLPGFTALEALRSVKGRGIPFILVTGSQSEEVAVGCMKEGADDYILKMSLKRLPPAILNAIARKDAGRRIVEANCRLRALSAGLVAVREEERARIAREIHDDLGQSLTALNIDLAWLRGKLTSPVRQVDDKLRGMAELVRVMILRVQQIAAELRPAILDDLGLAAAVRWQTEEFEKRTGVPCPVSVEEGLPWIERDRATVLFRILQETLTNVARHAHATAVAVGLRREENAIVLTVADNGIGMAAVDLTAPRSLGILGMNERAALAGGSVTFTLTPGGGTTVTARIPNGE